MSLVLPLILLLPLGLALAWSIPALRPLITRLTPWAALPALVASYWLPVGTEIQIPWLLLETRLGLDSTGALFLSFTALLWWLAGLYGLCYQAKDPHRERFFFFYLLTMTGNLGLILAQDTASFLFLFALMSMAAYGLIVHPGSEEARRAGRVYLTLVIIGEACLLSALILLAVKTGTVEMSHSSPSIYGPVVLTLLLIGFGIKLGLLPLHFSLPLAYGTAPVPGGAVLGGAMINAGLLGWLRFLPLGEMALPQWGNGLMIAGFAAAFYGVLVGLTQREPKILLAYSSISQIGLMTFGVGVGLGAPAHWPLVLTILTLFALHHALAKGILFLAVGLTRHSGGILVRLTLLFPALVLAGAPFTSGIIAKTALKSLSPLTVPPWSDGLPGLLFASSLGTTLLMARFINLTWPKDLGGRLPPGMWLPAVVLLFAVNFATWLWPAAEQAAAASLTLTAIKSGGWGVLLGIAFFILGSLLCHRLRMSWFIPGGDILILIERWFSFLARGANGIIYQTLQLRSQIFTLPQRLSGQWDLPTASAYLETVLRRWKNFGLLFLTIALLLFGSLIL
ncbi:complex I subunit 5 family protein [Nitrosococcus oceani]|uniref:complex I subunit 5 family protein n=1 Tax=Nitrosococcus oceani TaxID=1229 RepID=UPI0004E89334|nr:complex I subunit 5 family protein [Nitrosococcus oceani]KFI23008.1 NADH-ubiquinone oxidoreductase [Nitrosococcus oceani]